MNYGKFKDATSLFDGYVSLEKAYTKKCQDLSRLEKEFEALTNVSGEDSLVDTSNACGGKADECGKESIQQGQDVIFGLDDSVEVLSEDKSLDRETGGEVIMEIGLKEEGEKESENKVLDNPYERFKSPEWRKSVTKFFASNKEAVPLKAEIAKIIITDPELSLNEDCLSLAFEKVKLNRPASTDMGKSIEEQPLGESVKTDNIEKKNQDVGLAETRKEALQEQDEKDKEITLSEYLELVAKRKVSAPKFLTDKLSARNIGLTSPKKINSLADAKDYLLKNYFK